MASDNFEWGNDGDSLSDSGGDITWSVSVAGSSKAEIDTAQYCTGTRSARLYRDGTNDAVAYFTQSALSSAQVWRFRVRKDNTSWVYIRHGNSTKTISLIFGNDEIFYYYDTDMRSVKTLSKDTWWEIEIANVNWTAGTFDIYISGKLEKSSAIMLVSGANDNKIYFYNSLGTSECWIDDINIKTYSNFPAQSSTEVNIAFVNNPLDENSIWVDVSDYIRSINGGHGRNNDVDREETGKMDVVLNNNSGYFWPNNAYFSPNVDVLKRIKIKVYHNGIYGIWAGYIDEWEAGFIGDVIPIMTLHCTGILGSIIALKTLNNAGYAAETSGVRAGHILTDCNIPASWQVLDTGNETLLATGAQTNVNALERLQKIQEAEDSRLYEGADGTLVYESREHRFSPPHDAPVAIIGDDPGELNYKIFTLCKTKTLIFNNIRLTRTGGTEQVFENAASITKYENRSYIRTDLPISTDYCVGLQALRKGKKFSFPQDYVDSVIIELTTESSDADWEDCLSLDISSRITFRNNAAEIDEDYFIEGKKCNFDFNNLRFFFTFSMIPVVWNYTEEEPTVETLRPNANGDTIQLTSHSAPNYGAIADVVADDFTNYNYISVLGAYTDLYNIPSLSYIYGIVDQVKVYVRVNGSANGHIKIAIKTNGTVYYGSQINGSGGWVNSSATWTTNPATGNPFTIAEITALQIGILMVNNVNVNDAITQEYVEVTGRAIT